MNGILTQFSLMLTGAMVGLRDRVRRTTGGDSGQGTLEYVGIAIAVLAITVAVATVFSGQAGVIAGRVQTLIASLLGGGTAGAGTGP